jgi:hypothetical protein
MHYPGGIAASTIPLEQGGYEVLGPVKAQDCLWQLFGVIPVTDSNETHVAIAAALAQKPTADALIQVTSDAFSHYYVVVSRTCTEVDAIAVKSRWVIEDEPPVTAD